MGSSFFGLRTTRTSPSYLSLLLNLLTGLKGFTPDRVGESPFLTGRCEAASNYTFWREWRTNITLVIGVGYGQAAGIIEEQTCLEDTCPSSFRGFSNALIY